jgi:hypothetical protein
MTAAGRSARSSASVACSSGNAGSKYTQSAARTTSGGFVTISAGRGSPLNFWVWLVVVEREREREERRRENKFSKLDVGGLFRFG